MHVCSVLVRQDSIVAQTPMSVEGETLLSGDSSLLLDAAGGAQQDAAVRDAARREEEEKKDQEVLNKTMTQLPPVARRPGLLSRRKRSSVDSGLPHSVPSYYLSVTYGPSSGSASAAVQETNVESSSEVAMLSLQLPDSKATSQQEGEQQDVAAAQRPALVPSMMHKLSGSHEQIALAHRVAAVKRHTQAADDDMQRALVKREPSRQSGTGVLMLYSVNKVWESSKSVCIHEKSSRSSLLLSVKDGHMRMQQGVVKLLPLQHLMVHQMASTCHDMPLAAPLATPNAPPVPLSLQAVRSAIIIRTQLIKDGVTSAAHLGLEHMMRGEVGDDVGVMMALDPLSVPADANSIAYSMANVLPALDGLLPGMPRRMEALDLASLLGYPGQTMEEIAERLPAPALLVGEADNWVEVPPAALRWWEKLPLQPFGNKKNVVYCVICGSGGSNQQSTGNASEHETEASLFFKELSCMYESAHLGTHRQLDSKLLPVDDGLKGQRGAAGVLPPGPAHCNNAIVSVKSKPGMPAMPNATHGPRPPGPFEEACTRALKGLVQLDKMPAVGDADGFSGGLPVLYILEPDFALGNTWIAAPRPSHHMPPAQARAEWQRVLAKSIAALAVTFPRILDVVVQIVPVQRINIGRNMRWLLRDLAMSVYNKGRVRQRLDERIKPQDHASAVELDEETHNFFSAASISIKKKKPFVDRKLHEPLLTVPLPHAPEAPESTAEGAAMLQCSYVWSDDGLCLGAAVTDSTGEMLETFTALFPGVLSQVEGRMGAEAGRDAA